MSGPTSDTPVAEAAAHVSNSDVIRLAGNTLTHFCHQASVRASWWDHAATGLDLRQVINEPDGPLQKLLAGALVAQKLVLTHTEISEAVEGHRKGLMDEHLPHLPAIAVELADAVIRIADLAGAMGLPLGQAIAEKMAYNQTRLDHQPEARAAVGGKEY